MVVNVESQIHITAEQLKNLKIADRLQAFRHWRRAIDFASIEWRMT